MWRENKGSADYAKPGAALVTGRRIGAESVKPLARLAAMWLRRGWRLTRDRSGYHIRFWFLALLVGICAGLAAMLFRLAVEWIQRSLYQTGDLAMLHSHAMTLPWYWIVTLPVLGGLIVGWLMHRFTEDGRVRSVADVIEGSALNDGRVEVKAGLASAAASMVTLSSGGSSGREGPVVHLAGVIATAVSNRIKADGVTGRDLLGCAVASAVSASFNAPIAGALFALEVILRHFAVNAFAPIVIASCAGTVINRLVFGDVTEFMLGGASQLGFYVELPAFMLLGLVCGLMAIALIKAVFFAERIANTVMARTGLKPQLRPALAGFLLGVIALGFPHIIGVGYETTSAALTGQLGFFGAVVFAMVKVVAVAITLGGRMGGGIFSPSLMLGALTGLAFGIVATALLPQFAGSATLYALAGMGAVSAAVLGAPISTTLIVFELTGDWQTGLAVMVAVSLSTALASQLIDRSFFLSQLENRNIHLAAGPQAYLLAMVRVASLTKEVSTTGPATEAACWQLIEQGIYIDGAATLENAMPIFDKGGAAFLPVVTLWGDGRPPELLGVLYQVDALRAYNRRLAATAAEEHR